MAETLTLMDEVLKDYGMDRVVYNTIMNMMDYALDQSTDKIFSGEVREALIKAKEDLCETSYADDEMAYLTASKETGDLFNIMFGYYIAARKKDGDIDVWIKANYTDYASGLEDIHVLLEKEKDNIGRLEELYRKTMEETGEKTGKKEENSEETEMKEKIPERAVYHEFPDFEVNENGNNAKIEIHLLPEEKMRELGFTDYREGYWYYSRDLGDEIMFDLTVNKDDPSDYGIDVLDEEFCQPYDYQMLLCTKAQPPKAAIETYDKVEDIMRYLTEAGIVTGHTAGDYI